MSDKVYRQFANTIYNFVPDFPADEEEIVRQLKVYGLDGFVEQVSNYISELIETVQLLSKLVGGDDADEQE